MTHNWKYWEWMCKSFYTYDFRGRNNETNLHENKFHFAREKNVFLPSNMAAWNPLWTVKQTLYLTHNNYNKMFELGGWGEGSKIPTHPPPMRGHFAFCQSDSRHRQNPPSAAWAYCTRNTRLSQGIKSTKRIYLKTNKRLTIFLVLNPTSYCIYSCWIYEPWKQINYQYTVCSIKPFSVHKIIPITLVICTRSSYMYKKQSN